ncbi:c-type cytochrome [Solitalea koreensis]|uniref:Cytochrome c n=1 Tax=Solitalea koreensis TaxID=543615 RepID=A0A521BSV5_9SPHI|nr:c-type cytochrome [Solitalea koreensis]SMO49630.1 Cytochrome c [Solitalea koreensis]
MKAITELLFIGLTVLLTNCNKSTTSKESMNNEELITRGKYLVTIGSCNMCHSPKTPTFNGLSVDSNRLLSGHPEGAELSKLNIKLDSSATKAGNWTLASLDMTSFAGPWGISYTANLTPDTTTGIGAWTEEVFIATLRTGKHLGQAGGRQVLPPMPWNYVNQMTDDDLKAVYAYLRSLPPIQNQVPGPVPPDEVSKKLTNP